MRKPVHEFMKFENIKDMLQKTGEKYGQRPAYKFKTEKPNEFKIITHKEFREQINALGTALIDMGLKDKKIAVISDNRYEWGLAYLAIVAGTGVVVPLDKALPNNEIESLIKRSGVEAIFYSNKYDELGNSADIDLLKKLKEEGMLISMVNTHKSNDISSICYDILEELSKTDSYPIKKCQNCGMYFIPNSRLDEIYCDYPKENGKTCREQGAILSYNKRLQEKSAYTEYRKTYQQKFGIVNKNKDDKKLKAEFETWKKQAKEKIIKLKHGELTEDEVYEWLQENK